MIVFVDGHNVLHVLGIDAGSHEADRGTLLADVRERVRRLTPGATVFFDGHPPGGEFASSSVRGVRVVFSLSREADEAIVDAVRDADQAGRVLVVTDDLGLRRRVSQLGAKTSGVRTFFSHATERSEPHDEKPTGSGGFTAADFGLPEVIDLSVRPQDRAKPRRVNSRRGKHR